MGTSKVSEWGEKVAGLENSYERMRFKGVWYSLYDCVHVRSLAKGEPYVGKIMRFFEEDGRKKMRVRWFFKACELPVSASKEVGSSEKTKKELFLAQGSVKGVENVNVVETIIEKVTVLCTAKVLRNPLPSLRQVDDAHYFFSRVYDAGQRKLVKMERVDKALALKFFNKPEWISPPAVVETATWEDLDSPTSVTEFGRKRPFPSALKTEDTFTTKKFKGGSQSFSRETVAASTTCESRSS